MQIELALFKSTVAKRIFILFTLTAIIPVTLIGIISYNHITDLLSKQEQKHLSQQSKSYGMAIFDRILVAESQLNSLSNILLNKNNTTDSNNFIQNIESTPSSLLNNIKTYPYNNLSNKHLLDGKTKISISDVKSNLIINFSKLLIINGNTIMLSANVDPNYIFGDMDQFAGDDDACVIVKGIGALNCSNNSLNILSLSSFDTYMSKQDDTHVITIDNVDYIYASWELFLNGSYDTDSWHIYYTKPNNLIYSSIKSFGNILIPILLLSILLISLISIKQISKILVPLEKLTLLTKKISKRDFSDKISINSGDEFQDLGESFNLMAFELARQFTVMTAMSHLDRAILTTMNREKVIEAIFRNLSDYLEYQNASVVLLNNDSKNNAILYKYNQTDNHIHSKVPLNINDEDINLLLENTESVVRTQKREKLIAIDWLDNTSSNFITTIVVKHDHETIALIIISHQYFPQLDQEGINQLNNYTDRVKVALHAIEREEKLVKQANYDDLTGLPNRQMLTDTFDKLILNNCDQKIAVLFIDLDRFKIINDSQGHAIGDQLLIQASKRIQSCLDDDAFIARYGGDEFIILLPFDIDSSFITDISNNIINKLSKIFTINNYEQYIGASIGASVYPQDGKNWDDVVQKADIAMYKAKQSGRGRSLFFSNTMQAEILEKASLEADLFHSIDKNEIYMVYQPQINIATGEISGAETLMRWHHSTKGNIPPDQFIAYAEDSGFIIQLGIWAIRTTLKQCKDWQLENNPLNKISINVSPKQIRHESFINEIEMLVSDFDMQTTNIEFEITESLFLNDDISIISKLQHINKLGISIAIDDFGKGYSSLSYLKNLPIQTLKIDKLFIDDIHNDNDSLSIVKAIISMAKSLNKNIVAEGIESVEQLDILKKLDCDHAQGYFISKPKAAKEVMNYSKTAVLSLEDYRNNVKAS